MTTEYATDLLEAVDSAATNTAAAVNAGLAAAGPRPLDEKRFSTQVIPAGAQLKVIDQEELLEKFRARPRRKTGTVHVHTPDSFIDYLTKHALPETEVWADITRARLVAVINAHVGVAGIESPDATDADELAGYGDHRVNLELITTDAWKAWTANNKRWLDQMTFAEHIEDNALDVVSPDSATMLEIAESFQATTKAQFKSGKRLHSGQVTLQYEEDQGARAGENGDIDIPKVFTLDLTPFEGGKTYSVDARFRYRISGPQLALSYHLVNPQDVLRQAFIDYVTAVQNEINAPVYSGRPE
ncbi:MAG TPA: DUF2303 family protein [Nocardioidaceae bacterium]